MKRIIGFSLVTLFLIVGTFILKPVFDITDYYGKMESPHHLEVNKKKQDKEYIYNVEVYSTRGEKKKLTFKSPFIQNGSYFMLQEENGKGVNVKLIERTKLPQTIAHKLTE